MLVPEESLVCLAKLFIATCASPLLPWDSDFLLAVFSQEPGSKFSSDMFGGKPSLLERPRFCKNAQALQQGCLQS